MADLPVRSDHSVIHVSDWERARNFYTRVIGATAVSGFDAGQSERARIFEIRTAL